MKFPKKSYLTILLLFLLFKQGYSQKILPYEDKIVHNTDYIYSDISVHQNKGNFDLKGTLIAPKTNYEKLVIIVPGAGKDTRHSHYVLAENLLKNNIGIFRYDDRGVAESGGKYSTVSNTVKQKSADLFAIVNALKNNTSLKNKKIGIIGHSEGGLTTIRGVSKGMSADFLILLSAPVVNATEFFQYQIKTGVNKQEKNLKYDTVQKKFTVMDSIANIIHRNQELNDHDLRKVVRKKMRKYGYKNRDFGWYITYSSYLDFLRTDYTEIYQQLSVPVLYIVGEKDRFIDPVRNIHLLNTLNNKNVKIISYPGLYHYLIDKKVKRDTNIYNINSKVAAEIIDWILNN